MTGTLRSNAALRRKPDSAAGTRARGSRGLVWYLSYFGDLS